MDEAVVVALVAIIAAALVDVVTLGVVGGVGRPNGRKGWPTNGRGLDCNGHATQLPHPLPAQTQLPNKLLPKICTISGISGSSCTGWAIMTII